MQVSDWAARPLSDRQQQYAALDAAVQLQLFSTMAASSDASAVEDLHRTWQADAPKRGSGAVNNTALPHKRRASALGDGAPVPAGLQQPQSQAHFASAESANSAAPFEEPLAGRSAAAAEDSAQKAQRRTVRVWAGSPRHHAATGSGHCTHSAPLAMSPSQSPGRRCLQCQAHSGQSLHTGSSAQHARTGAPVCSKLPYARPVPPQSGRTGLRLPTISAQAGMQAARFTRLARHLRL